MRNNLEAEVFPNDFIGKCKKYPNMTKFILKDVKKNIQHIGLGNGFFVGWFD